MTKNTNREEKDFNREIYKIYIQNEISHPEFVQNRDRFIKIHWDDKKRFIFPAFPAFGFSLPVFILIALLAAYVFRVPAKTSKAPPPEIGDVLTNGVSPYKIHENNVSVMRVSSKAGPTMVYQKMYDDVPLTIVWVFPGEIN